MIVLVGSHGVGKSTLMKEFALENPNYYCTDGFSRPIRESCLKQNLSKEIEQVLINDMTIWGWKNNLLRENYLTTRSIIDALIYSGAFKIEDEAQRLYEIWKDTYIDAMNNIKFFYIPIEFPLEDDGVRFTDTSFQFEIDSKLYQFLKSEKVDFNILTGSVEDRLSILKENL